MRDYREMAFSHRPMAASKTFSDLNPADGSVWAEIPDMNRLEARAAIDKAQAACSEWSALPFNKRAHFMIKIAAVLEKRGPEIADALVGEGGSWFGKAMFEATFAPEIFYSAAATNYTPIGELLPSEHGKVSMVVRRPIGVVSVISPWHVPLLLTGRGMAFALAAGNTIVLKPSEETPYTGGLVYAEVFAEAGLPEGVLNVVTCSREHVQEVGDELIENPLVKGVSFTGSSAVGRHIAAKCGAHLKKCCVELGGKDALIVCDDADMERATAAANFGSFMHQGQICMSVEKVLAHESIFEPFLARFIERASMLKVGDPSKDKSHVIGPLINDKQAAKVADQLNDAVAKGAKVVLGGGVNGRYIEPTILVGVTPEMKIYQEETFGPVVPVFPFKDDDEAIAMANDTQYGLCGYFYSRDVGRIWRVAEALEYGIVGINEGIISTEVAPFGGVKESGVGREGAHYGLDEYMEVKYLCMGGIDR